MAAPVPSFAAAGLPAADPGEPLIGGVFALDPARELPGAGGGVPAIAVQDRRSGRRDLMALAVPPGLAPRARTLAGLVTPIEGLLGPLAYGVAARHGGKGGERGLHVVCPAPPGPSVAAPLTPWPEAALLDQVLRPIAQVLGQLAERGLTHRAIRPDNVFRAGAGEPVVLGAAWAAPPAMHQPAANEPPYVAMCLPAGRGEGSIADDIYALGVLLLTLAVGAPPLSGFDPAAVIRRKLELGSFEALAGETRLPGLLGDLLRGMLAEDPEHRPNPALLDDPGAARSRRVAARPPRRAGRPLKIGATTASGARGLALALATAPEAGLRALRSGAVDLWLRRDLGDASLSLRLEEALRLRGAERQDAGPDDAMLLVRAVATLDPLAPLCWPGVTVWPDGLGSALAAASARDPAASAGAEPAGGVEAMRRLVALVQAEAVAGWAEARVGRADPLTHRAEARQWRAWLQTSGPTGGLSRLVYGLNPLLPCASPLLARQVVATLVALPAALDRIATPAPPPGAAGPIDADILAFVAARQEHASLAVPEARNAADPPAATRAIAPLAQVELLARLQNRFHPAPLPGLARWLAAVAAPLVAAWHHHGQRAEIGARLAVLAEAGTIAPMLALLNDSARRLADERGFRAAAVEVARIDAEIGALEAGGPQRAALARQWGQELAAGIGIAALAAVLGLAALG